MFRLTIRWTVLNKMFRLVIRRTSSARSRHSPTHLSLLTATLLLCGDIQPNSGPTNPANLLICTLSTRSMLTPEHVTALHDLTDNHKPDINPLTETWIRSSTTPAELIDSTPPGYSLFSAPRSHTGNASKPILTGATTPPQSSALLLPTLAEHSFFRALKPPLHSFLPSIISLLSRFPLLLSRPASFNQYSSRTNANKHLWVLVSLGAI